MSTDDWPAPDYWCTICDRGAEGCLHTPEDAPDFMHDQSKPWGLAAHETGSACGETLIAGHSTVIDCARAEGHEGDHRSFGGSEWGTPADVERRGQ